MRNWAGWKRGRGDAAEVEARLAPRLGLEVWMERECAQVGPGP